MVFSVRWKILELSTTEVVEHRSDKYTCFLSPLQKFRFRLIFRNCADQFELLIESLTKKDLDLKLALSIESNGHRKTKKAENVHVLGRVDGGSPLARRVSLMEDDMAIFGFGERAYGITRKLNITYPAAIIHLNIFNDETNDLPELIAADSKDENNSLITDMLQTLERGIGADLTIVSGEREFRCQSGILAARSKVFAAMFEHDFEERRTSKLEIDDLSPEATAQLIRFFYTDTVENLKSHYKELLMASNKYDLPKLKLMCEQTICAEVREANLLSTLLLCQQHLAIHAKRFCIQHIVETFPALVKKDEWRQFVRENPELLCEVLDELATKLTELIESDNDSEGEGEPNMAPNL